MDAATRALRDAIRKDKRLQARAWAEGQLWWLLDDLQYGLYRQFYAATDLVVWNTARRIGKTFCLLVLACEAGLRGKHRSIKYAASTAKSVRKMIRPNLRKVIDTCPPALRPKPDWQQGEIRFANGSVIDVAGCDNGHDEDLRGQEAHLWIVDEGGFITNLEYVVDSVLDPQTWTTGGRGIIASTPSLTPGHPFQQYYLSAKANGTSARATFWEGRQNSDETKQEIIRKSARRKRMSIEEYLASTAWKREGLAEFVLEETRAVVPEFTEALADELTVAEFSTPLFADWYTVTDLGGSRDPTGIMVGYWDFARKKFRVQQAKKLLRPTTEQIANATRELEREAFGLHRDAPASPLRGSHFRYIDDPLGIVARDLAQKHDLATTPPRKEDKDAALMDLRDSILRREVEFSPDAREVVAQCQAAIWNKQHTEFERVEGFGHFEFVDCLLYASRNYIPNRGRVPPLYGLDLANMTRAARAADKEPDASSRAWSKAFGG